MQLVSIRESFNEESLLEIDVSHTINNMGDYDPFKNDIYSLGLTLLYAISLKNVEGVNRYPEAAEERL